jgi:hypothetical protein
MNSKPFSLVARQRWGWLVLLLAAWPALAQNFAVQLDGEDDRVVVTNFTAFPTNAVTVEFWVRSTNTTKAGTPVSYASSNNANSLFVFDYRNFICAVNNNWTPPTGVSANDGQWHHIAMTWTNSGVLRLFKDGLLVFSTNRLSSNQVIRAGGVLMLGQEQDTIGGSVDTNQALLGELDEVRIWNVVRSPAEIASSFQHSLSGGEPGLVLYYRFDEGVGTQAGNAAPPNIAGTMGFGANWLAPGVPLMPSVFTRSATNLSGTSAQLFGEVQTHGAPTEVRFGWGAGSNLTQFTPWQWVTNNGLTSFTDTLASLSPGVDYSYRAEFRNALGAGQGNLRTLNTTFLSVNLGDDIYLLGSSSTWADLNNDGRPDIVDVDSYVDVLWNTTNGFVREDAYLGFNIVNSTLGDMNGDGLLDLVTVIRDEEDWDHPWELRVFLNHGGPLASRFQSAFSMLLNLEPEFLELADVDRDGDNDVILASDYAGAGEIELFRNNEASGRRFLTSLGNAGMTNLYDATFAVGDFDGDSLADILMAGDAIDDWPEIEPVTRLYRNNGDGTFSVAPMPFTNVLDATISLVDFDLDGRLDVFLLGTTGTSYEDDAPVVRLYRNTGSGFADSGLAFPQVQYGEAAWGDFDNDGWPDLVMGGTFPGEPETPVFVLLRNVSGTGFESVNAGLPNLTPYYVLWVDWNSDGRLDLAFEASAWPEYMTGLWTSQTPVANTPPTPPGGLAVAITNGAVTFTWGLGSDAQTLAAGLTYNLRIGTSPGANDVFTSTANTNGTPLLVRQGNVDARRSITVRLPIGRDYFWSVQSIDAGFAASPFATDRSFGLHGVLSPPAQAPVLGDLDGDGLVDLSELNAVIQNYRGLRR